MDGIGIILGGGSPSAVKLCCVSNLEFKAAVIVAIASILLFELDFIFYILYFISYISLLLI